MADEQRLITQRGNYLARSTDLRETEAEALAYTQFGYSWQAVAKELGSGQSTVKDWMERAMAQYGLEITETLAPDELEPPLSKPSHEEVGIEYLDELQTDADRKRWAECVERNTQKLPRSWVNEIVDELEDRGYL